MTATASVAGASYGTNPGLLRAGLWGALSLFLLYAINTVAAAEKTPTLAVIIDDLGFRLIEDQAVLALDPRISVAIIPNAPLARRMAAKAYAQQRTVLVHLPLSQGPSGECDAPICPRREWSPERMRQHLAWAFEEVHGATGLNNHQGSLFTADPAATRRLIEGLKLFSRGRAEAPFVIDSRTTPASHLANLASAAGFYTAERDVFLDHDRRPEAMTRAWNAAIDRARSQGHAVVIGHPHPETIAFLDQALALLESQGVALVALPEVLQAAGRAEPARPARAAAQAAYRSRTSPPGP